MDPIRVAVAESLTGGLLSSRLARRPGASEWFAGGIVAYTERVKFDLLDVPHGPVVSRVAALAMARSAARLLGADAAVAVTGVGGPGSEDGVPAGTVWIAVAADGREEARLHRFAGAPTEICERTCDSAVAMLGELTDRAEQFGLRQSAPVHEGSDVDGGVRSGAHRSGLDGDDVADHADEG